MHDEEGEEREMRTCLHGQNAVKLLFWHLFNKCRIGKKTSEGGKKISGSDYNIKSGFAKFSMPFQYPKKMHFCNICALVAWIPTGKH